MTTKTRTRPGRAALDGDGHESAPVAKRGARPRHVEGRRYGSLVLSECLGPDAHGHTVARYVCDCGGERVARASTIANGSRRHCGDVEKHRAERVVLPQRWKRRPGDRYGSLVIVERLGAVKGSQRVRCKCDCGAFKELNLQNLTSGATTNCTDRQHHPHPWKGDEIAYHAAHQRITSRRGRASEHRCIWCPRQAEQWALGHTTANIRRDTTGKDSGKPYSTGPNDYQPMCRTCHQRFDRKHREMTAGTPEGSVSLLHLAAFIRHGGTVAGLVEADE